MRDDTILLNINRFGPIFSEAEKNWLLTKPKKAGLKDHKVHLIESLEEFLEKDFEKIKKSEIKRYYEITDEETHLSLTPGQNYENITSRVVQPLVLCKKYFSFSEYLSRTTLAGFSAEMMTHVLWEMTSFKIKNKVMDADSQKIVFGRLDQERRIKILHLINVINDTERGKLEEIRKIRNKYIHSWDIKSKQDKGNAKKAIRFALTLFKNISGINLTVNKDGKQQLQVNPKFLSFIKSKVKR